MQGWRSGSKRNNFVLVCSKVFWENSYSSDPIPDPEYQYVSLSQRGLGRQAPHILQYFYLTTTYVQLLTQPRTCKMGSSILAAMS